MNNWTGRAAGDLRPGDFMVDQTGWTICIANNVHSPGLRNLIFMSMDESDNRGAYVSTHKVTSTYIFHVNLGVR